MTVSVNDEHTPPVRRQDAPTTPQQPVFVGVRRRIQGHCAHPCRRATRVRQCDYDRGRTDVEKAAQLGPSRASPHRAPAAHLVADGSLGRAIKLQRLRTQYPRTIDDQ